MTGSGDDASRPSVISGPAKRPGPNSWLAPAVVATLCCFAPTGIVALYFAAQVNLLWDNGDRQAAATRARQARTWVLVSVVLWVVAMVILVTTGRFGRLLEAGLI